MKIIYHIPLIENESESDTQGEDEGESVNKDDSSDGDEMVVHVGANSEGEGEGVVTNVEEEYDSHIHAIKTKDINKDNVELGLSMVSANLDVIR